MVSKEYIDSVLADFGEGDIVLLQNEISNVDYIINQAYEKKIKHKESRVDSLDSS